MASMWAEAAVLGFIRSVSSQLATILGSSSRFEGGGIRRRDLIAVKERLGRIRDVVNDAQSRLARDDGVRRWMDDLNDVLYDLEDIVDELCLANDRLMRLAADPTDKVDDLVGIRRLKRILSKRPSSLLPAVNFMSSKERKISPREKMKHILIRLDAVLSEATKLDLEACQVKTAEAAAEEARFIEETGTKSLDVEEIYGREEDVNRVIELLLSHGDGDSSASRNYSVICVVGIGGIGKTTLAKLVFQNETVKQNFHLRSWATASDNFDVGRVRRDLVEYAAGGESYPDDMGTNSLQLRLQEIVSNKKSLLVLDDVWNIKKWEELEASLSHCAKGSKVLVTTRDMAIADALSGTAPYSLGPLDYDAAWALFKERAGLLKDDAAWALFKERAFGHVGRRIQEEEVIEIARECRGVPLAIKVMAGTLLGAPSEKLESVGRDLISRLGAPWEWWESVGRDLISRLWSDDPMLLPALSVSYDYLPSHLKRCFMYLSLFPRSYQLDQSLVVSLWIAEGFVEPREGRLLEDIGIQYFNELRRMSFIESDYKMHDLVYDLALFISSTCFLCSDVSKHNQLNNTGKIRHVSIFTPHMEHTNPLEFLQRLGVTKLRTLLLSDFSHSIDSLEIPPGWSFLRVLDLRETNIPEIPVNIGNLVHLRYLNLSGNRRLEKLPDQLCLLYHLQVLELESCQSLIELPPDIGNLRSLRLLSTSKTAVSSLPVSACKLTNLLVLDLHLCKSLANIPQEMGNIRSLKKLHFQQMPIASLPESISELVNLQTLDLKGCENLALLPREVGKLSSLLELELGSTSISSLPESIGELVNLQTLDLKGCKNLALLPREVGKLSSLLELDLESTSISSLPDSICKLKKLRSLKLRDCSKLTSLPENIGNLNNLRVFDLHSTSISTLPQSIFKLYILELLDLECCKKLTHLTEVNRSSKELWQVDSCLLNLKVKACSSLREIVLPLRPGYGRVEIKDCPQLDTVDIHMGGGVKISIRELIIDSCPNLKSLPKSGLLIQTSLHIAHCSQLRLSLDHLVNDMLDVASLKQLYIDCNGFHLTFNQVEVTENQLLELPRKLNGFTSLQVIDLNDCPLFQEIPIDALPSSIRELNIADCPRLKSLPTMMRRLTSLTSLKIHDCPQIIGLDIDSLPSSLVELHVTICHNMKYLLGGLHQISSLRVLRIYSCPQIQAVGDGKLPASLQEVVVHGCNRLMLLAHRIDNLANLTMLQLTDCENLPAPVSKNLLGLTVLEELRIDYTAQLECLLVNGLPVTIKKLKVWGVGSSNSFPKQGWLQNLASLQKLKIADFPKEILFQLDDDVSSSLQKLSICDFTSLMNLPEALSSLTSLKKLKISNCPRLESFSESELPPSLVDLKISNCLKLRHLPKKLSTLTCLESFTISKCPQLELRPPDRFPSKILSLIIIDCPKLVKQLHDETDVDWTIEHIPFRNIMSNGTVGASTTFW